MSKFVINNPAFLSMAGNIGSVVGTFYIKAIEDSTTITFGYPTYTQISKNDIDYEYASESMVINAGEKIYIKFDSVVIAGEEFPAEFSADKIFNAGGNCPFYTYRFEESGEIIEMEACPFFHNSLIYDASKLVINLPPTMQTRTSYLFDCCTSLVNAPKLPATTLTEGCYEGMFYECTSLVNAPELPATTLAKGCYSDMFYGCTSLVNAPELPATTLANSCYYNMFNGCSSLVNAPELPAEILKDYCYACMFWNCTSLVNAPILPATTLADGCYDSMFKCCTSLVNAPELPATTLIDGNFDSSNPTGCYYEMFYECTSLVNAPELPAKILKDYCYNSMFYGCSNLRNVECLAVDISAEECLSNWLYDVSETGTFTKAAGVDWPTGEDGIPTGWTVVEQ